MRKIIANMAKIIVGLVFVLFFTVINACNTNAAGSATFTVNKSGNQDIAIGNCIKAAYTAGGAFNKIKDDFNSNGSMKTYDNVISAILKTCKSCKGSNNDWYDAATYSATWLNSSSSDAYAREVDVPTSSANSTSYNVYLRTATLVCGGGNNLSDGMDRHYINFQNGTNAPCPLGTTYSYSNGKAKCEGTRKKVSYLQDIYSGSTWLKANPVTSNSGELKWISAGSSTTLKFDVKDFRNGSNAKKAHANHKYTYEASIWNYGCVRNATPGMTVALFGYGCVDKPIDINVVVKDPKVILKAVDKNGASLSSVFENKTEYGDGDALKDVEISADKNDNYTFLGFRKNAKDSNTLKVNDKTNENQIVKKIEGNTITLTGVNADTTIYAAYEKNEKKSFKGRAEVNKGSSYSTSKSNNYEDTGYVNTNKSVSTGTINCAKASDCKATFRLSTKREAPKDGSYATPYQIQRCEKTSGTCAKADFSKLSGSGWSGNAANNEPLKLINGEDIADKTVCYRIYFSTDGSGNALDGPYAQACATGKVASEKGFEGKAEVSVNGVNKSTGYTQTNKSVNAGTVKCESENNCTAEFKMSIQRIGGADTDQTPYVIQKCIKEGGGTCSNFDTILSSSTKGKGPKWEPLWSGSDNIVNRTVCYRMSFSKDGSASNIVTVQACATGKYSPPPIPGCEEWVPSSYDGAAATQPAVGGRVDGTTTTISKVKNNNVAKYNNWTLPDSGGFVYAKPRDNVSWVHCDYPGVQRVANILVTTNHNNSDNPAPSCGDHWSSSCSPDIDSYSLTNVAMHTVDPWSNTFKISSNGSFGAGRQYNPAPQNGGTGDTTVMKDENSHDVLVVEVGTTLTEEATTESPETAWAYNYGPHSWSCKWAYIDDRPHPSYPIYSASYCHADLVDGTCPAGQNYRDLLGYEKRSWYDWTGTCNHTEDYIDHSSSGTASSYADVRVPYNYINETENIKSIDPVGPDDDDKEIAFAGESKDVIFDILTKPRSNSETEDEYATRVTKALYKLIVCYTEPGGSEVCEETNKKKTTGSYGEGILNGDGRKEGATQSQKESFNIPDIMAGSEVCVTASVYPAESADESTYGSEGWKDEDGNHKWSEKTESNTICYKVAKKPSFQVWGGGVYSADNINTPVAMKDKNVFGGYNPNVLGSKYVFGSWVELGLVSNGVVKGLASGAGPGYTSNDNGNLVANPGGSSESGKGEYCKRSTLSFANMNCSGGSVGEIGGTNRTLKANENRESLISDVAANIESTSEINEHIKENGNAEVGVRGETLGFMNGNHLVEAGGDVTIVGNITYVGKYETLNEIPKYIIYAKGNIRIDCSVSRVDAVLIAEKNINTCVDGDNDKPDVNSPARSNRLVINGALIADTLTLGRTYGAGSGNNSIVPAEIINYDTSIYLWAYNGAKVTGSGETSVVYQRELAPRL